MFPLTGAVPRPVVSSDENRISAPTTGSPYWSVRMVRTNCTGPGPDSGISW